MITDLIIGNSNGDIGLVTCGKFIVLKTAAHKGMINNIKISDAVYDVGLIQSENSCCYHRRG